MLAGIVWILDGGDRLEMTLGAHAVPPLPLLLVARLLHLAPLIRRLVVVLATPVLSRTLM